MITKAIDHITAIRFYWTAYGIITGRCGHVSKGPKWTFWAGLHEIAKSLQRRGRGELTMGVPKVWKAPRDVRDIVKELS